MSSGADVKPKRRILHPKLRSFISQAAATLAFFGVVFLILFAVLWKQVVITVPAGSVGVMWYRFFGGTDTTTHLGEGLQLIFPWDKIYIYDARPQRSDYEFSALTKEGLAVSLTITVTTVIELDTVGHLHKAVGPQYIQTLVEPTVFASVRELVAGYSSNHIYDVARSSIEPALTEIVNDHVNAKEFNTNTKLPLVKVSRVNIRTIKLPPEVANAVEEKQIAEQASLRYEFVLQRETLESKRKEIEAMGVKRFQEIVTPTISEQYLRWRGIDATLQLALSPNSKVVVIGNGRDGLPLILDTRSDALNVAPAVSDADSAAAKKPPHGMDGGVDSTGHMELIPPEAGNTAPVMPLQVTPILPPILP